VDSRVCAPRWVANRFFKTDLDPISPRARRGPHADHGGPKSAHL